MAAWACGDACEGPRRRAAVSRCARSRTPRRGSRRGASDVAWALAAARERLLPPAATDSATVAGVAAFLDRLADHARSVSYAPRDVATALWACAKIAEADWRAQAASLRAVAALRAGADRIKGPWPPRDIAQAARPSRAPPSTRRGPRPRDGRGRAGLRPLVAAGRADVPGPARGWIGRRPPTPSRRSAGRAPSGGRAPSCGRTRAGAPSSAASPGRPRAWPQFGETPAAPSIPSPPTGPWRRMPTTTARATRAARRWATRRRRPARRWRERGGCARSTTRAWRWRRPARRKSNWRPSTPRPPMN